MAENRIKVLAEALTSRFSLFVVLNNTRICVGISLTHCIACSEGMTRPEGEAEALETRLVRNEAMLQ